MPPRLASLPKPGVRTPGVARAPGRPTIAPTIAPCHGPARTLSPAPSRPLRTSPHLPAPQARVPLAQTGVADRGGCVRRHPRKGRLHTGGHVRQGVTRVTPAARRAAAHWRSARAPDPLSTVRFSLAWFLIAERYRGDAPASAGTAQTDPASRSPSHTSMDDSECKRGAWSRQEDLLLQQLVSSLGTRSWVAISKGIPSRSAKSCRLRCARHRVVVRRARPGHWIAEGANGPGGREPGIVDGQIRIDATGARARRRRAPRVSGAAPLRTHAGSWSPGAPSPAPARPRVPRHALRGRRRWCNQLAPGLLKTPFSEWEQAVIVRVSYAVCSHAVS
jgi:hypothetical protein